MKTIKKLTLTILVLCTALCLSACTDYKSQVEELETTISEKDEKIEELESEITDCEDRIADYKNQLKEASATIAKHEATINKLNEQSSAANSDYNTTESNTVGSNTAENNIGEYNTEKSETVYVTKTGKKYHSANCSYLSLSSFSMTLDDAIAAGYTPCSRCR